jgi:uncharacterized glyoxalase superfamily protein PhnB
MSQGTKITPVLRYRNPRTAARWLCDAFGFREHDAAEEPGGHLKYVVLRLGSSFVLVRPVADLGFDDLLVQPEAVGGANTQVCYVTVADVDAHRVRAEAGGARIEIEPQDDGLGGHFYTCRDIEGHLWSFGTRTYGLPGTDPGEWQLESLPLTQGSTALTVVPSNHRAGRPPSRLRTAAVLAAMVCMVVGGWTAYRTYVGAEVQAERALEQLAQERRRLAEVEDASRAAAMKLADEREVAADVRRLLERAQMDVARERKRGDEALAALADAKAQARSLEQAIVSAEKARSEAARDGAASAALAKAASDRAAELKEQVSRMQRDDAARKEDLKETRAALLAAQSELEKLRSTVGAAEAERNRVAITAVTGEAQKAEPLQPAGAEKVNEVGPAAPAAVAEAVSQDAASAEEKAVEPKTACAAAVQGKVPFGRKGSSTWAEGNLTRLCRGAETSLEPVKCFEELMRGKVSWGGGTVWMTQNALALCGGARNARRTLDCFSAQIAAEEPWPAAIRRCRPS